MSRKLALSLALVAVIAVVVVIAWSGGRKPSPAPDVAPVPEAAPAETPIEPVTQVAEVTEAAPAAAPVVEALPVEATAPATSESVETLPEPEVAGPQLMPAPQQEPVILDPKCKEFMDAMKEKLGWEKIEGLKGKLTMDMAIQTPQGPHQVTMAGDMTIAKPNKLNMTYEINAGGQVMRMYQISDGVFMETGFVGPDGKRAPMQSGASNQAQGMFFGGDMLNANTYDNGEITTVKPDASEFIFQKDDGSVVDAPELTRLSVSNKERSIEWFVDPSTMQPVATRMYQGGQLAVECSHMNYQDLGDGILYPVTYAIDADASAMGAPAGTKVKMTMKMSDLELNPELAPDAFNFTAPGK